MPPASGEPAAGADVERVRVLRAFVSDGRLRSIPASRAKRLHVLDVVVQAFEPGERYSERRVNLELGRWHADVAALRRHLVDEDLLSRDPDCRWYWRSGGSFDPEGAA